MSGHDLPSIHSDDPSYGGGRRGVDVRTEPGALSLLIGEDLVLWVQREPDPEKDRPLGRRVFTDRYLTGVCDGSANHLRVLAITPRWPSDAVLTAAIATAQAAWPTHVVIPDEDKATAARFADFDD